MKLTGRNKQWEYLLAGKATITIENKQSNNRFTFKIKKKKQNYIDAATETPGLKSLYFVSVLTGSDNENDYTYMGTIFFGNDGKGEFRETRNSKVTKTAQSFLAFNWLFEMLQQDKELPEYINFYHEGFCGRCGRTLTVPESIESGFGPECINLI